MVLVKRALSPRAQEALELIAAATVFHTVRDIDSMHLHATYGNATLSLVVPLAAWAELQGLIDWDEGEAGPMPRVIDRAPVSLLKTLPVASNDSADLEAAEQLDLPLPTHSAREALEAAGQQSLDLGVA